jgi:CTP-dependent riboflavin kinase
LEALVFEGAITSGVGRHVELHVPGQAELPRPPADWPTKLHPGSLNVRITTYPALFREKHLPNSARSLDSNCFSCAFEIAQNQFGNNQLFPDNLEPRKGSAQVWRAALVANGQDIPCWVLRRYGSGLTDQLELLSDVHLRSKYHLENGHQVLVRLLSGATAA